MLRIITLGGVIISDQASNNILNNNVANNNLWGIIIWYNSNNTLNNNTADNNQENGIWLTNTKNNTLTKNTANNNRYGAYLYSTSANNILLSNLFCNNLVNDIKDADSNSGDKNTCDTIFNWNDIGTIGCTYGCSPPSPPKPNCTDNIKNQNETDVDCGGNCDKCADGKSCLSKDDCQSHYCAGGLCLICPIENLTTNPFSYSGDYVFNESRLSEKEKEVLPYVYKYSKEYEISPALIMAIIKKESNFNSESYGDQFKGYYCDELFKKKLIKDLKCEFRAYGYMQLWATAACDGGFGGEELNITQPLDYTWWYKWFIARYFCVNNSDCKIKFEAAHGNQNKKENLVALYNWFKLPATKQALQFSFSAKEEAKAESSFFAYVDWPVQGIEANTNIHYGSGYLKKQYVRYSNPKRVYKDALKNTISAYHNGNAIADNKYVEPVIQYYEDYKSKAIC